MRIPQPRFARFVLALMCLPLVSLVHATQDSAFKTALAHMQQAPVQHVTVDDINIAYKTFGDGEPLFAITGNGDTMDLWSPLFIEGLAKAHKVYIFDNRGAGLTSSGTKPFTIEQFADDTAAFMAQMGYKRAKVLGFSMGSRIALQLTIDKPDMVEKVVLYGCAPGGKQEVKRTAAVQKIFADTSGTPAQQKERMFSVLIPKPWRDAHPDPSTYFPPTTETITPEVRAKQNKAVAIWPGVYDQLGGIQTPTLIMAGTADEVVPPANAVTLVDNIPASWLVRLQGGGHGMMYQFPEQMIDIVNTFFLTAN
jgi:pimeloyl-ACP methyl ester carboxylesterase